MSRGLQQGGRGVSVDAGGRGALRRTIGARFCATSAEAGGGSQHSIDPAPCRGAHEEAQRVRIVDAADSALLPRVPDVVPSAAVC